MNATFQTLTTPDGPFTVIEDEQGRVIASGWAAGPAPLLERVRAEGRPTSCVESAHESHSTQAVRAYYDGNLTAIDDVPVHQVGTMNQLAGWTELRRIVPGSPLSYTEFAEALGTPQAVRAAASVCARNTVGLFVPCHRVLRGDGTLGGFAWGEDIKRSLLAREDNGVNDAVASAATG